MPYPPPPGPRVAYDTNGSILLMRPQSGIVKEVQPGAAEQMNSERANYGWTYGSSYVGNYGPDNVYTATGSTPNPKDQYLVLMFPVPMRLYGIFCPVHSAGAGSASSGQPVDLYTAPDTTNGDDGTWSFLQKIPAHVGGAPATVTFKDMLIPGGAGVSSASIIVNDYYRKVEVDGGHSVLAGSNARHVRGLKLVTTGAYYGLFWKLHVYGEPDTDASENILVFWDPVDDLSAAGDLLDWGDVPQGSTADKAFRVKNNSSAQTANNIVINAQMGYTTTNPVPSDSLLFSFDGNTWTTSLTLAALSPNAISGVIQVRRTTPLNAQPSNWAPRVVATVGSWS